MQAMKYYSLRENGQQIEFTTFERQGRRRLGLTFFSTLYRLFGPLQFIASQLLRGARFLFLVQLMKGSRFRHLVDNRTSATIFLNIKRRSMRMMLQVMVKKLSNNEKIEWWQCVCQMSCRAPSLIVSIKRRAAALALKIRKCFNSQALG